MAVVKVGGDGARKLLQHCFSKDLEHCLVKGSPLVDGRCVYGVFLDEHGHVIDDAIVCQLRKNLFMVVVNAGMGGPVSLWLEKNRDESDVLVEDLTDRAGKMDIQGPASARVLARVLKNPEAVFTGLTYFASRGSFGSFEAGETVELLDGTEVMLSRTGYTGEFGFEIFLDVEKLQSLWNMILQEGQPEGVIACGLAARDSLRAGAVLPLSHQDIGDWPFLNNPWQFALPWNEDKSAFTKTFIGAAGLLASGWRKHTLPFCGFDPRKITADPANFVTTAEGEPLGSILTCTTDMAIGRSGDEIISAATAATGPRGLSCGFVLLDRDCRPGETVFLTDGKRRIKVEIRSDIRPHRTARNRMETMLERC
jgi:aminomethyltransferase